MSGIGPEEAVILLVDDSDDDVLLTRLALRRARVPNPLVVVRDIEEAISYLEGTGNYANRAEFPLPALVLLDISLTDGTGFTLLRWVRGHSGLRQLRIVMLTCSNEHTDIDDAYSLGCNSYVIKPLKFSEYVELVRVVVTFWLNQSAAPALSRDLNNG